MTTRTLAATAATLPHDILDRRTMLASAGAAAVLAAIGAPAMAEADPDAGLLALRAPWLATRAAYAAETLPRTAEFVAGLADLPYASHLDDPEARRAVMRARCDALDVLERRYPQAVMSAEAEARQEKALDDEGDVIAEIVAVPALTLAGLGFKVEVSTANDHMGPELVASIMTDVAAFAAAHAATRI